jgi:hypothetical protein
MPTVQGGLVATEPFLGMLKSQVWEIVGPDHVSPLPPANVPLDQKRQHARLVTSPDMGNLDSAFRCRLLTRLWSTDWRGDDNSTHSPSLTLQIPYRQDV